MIHLLYVSLVAGFIFSSTAGSAIQAAHKRLPCKRYSNVSASIPMPTTPLIPIVEPSQNRGVEPPERPSRNFARVAVYTPLTFFDFKEDRIDIQKALSKASLNGKHLSPFSIGTSLEYNFDIGWPGFWGFGFALDATKPLTAYNWLSRDLYFLVQAPATGLLQIGRRIGNIDFGVSTGLALARVQIISGFDVGLSRYYFCDRHLLLGANLGAMVRYTYSKHADIGIRYTYTHYATMLDKDEGFRKMPGSFNVHKVSLEMGYRF